MILKLNSQFHQIIKTLIEPIFPFNILIGLNLIKNYKLYLP